MATGKPGASLMSFTFVMNVCNGGSQLSYLDVNCGNITVHMLVQIAKIAA